jgi:hypothetical protein
MRWPQPAPRAVTDPLKPEGTDVIVKPFIQRLGRPTTAMSGETDEQSPSVGIDSNYRRLVFPAYLEGRQTAV